MKFSAVVVVRAWAVVVLVSACGEAGPESDAPMTVLTDASLAEDQGPSCPEPAPAPIAAPPSGVGPRCAEGFSPIAEGGCQPNQAACAAPRVRVGDRCEPTGPDTTCPLAALAEALADSDAIHVDAGAESVGADGTPGRPWPTLEAALAVGEGTLVIHPGRYRVTEPLELSGRRLVGGCVDTTVVVLENAGRLRISNGSSHLSGFSVEGGETAVEVGVGGRLQLEDVRVRGAGATGVQIAGRGTLRRVRLDGSPTGLLVQGEARVEGVWFEGGQVGARTLGPLTGERVRVDGPAEDGLILRAQADLRGIEVVEPGLAGVLVASGRGSPEVELAHLTVRRDPDRVRRDGAVLIASEGRVRLSNLVIDGLDAGVVCEAGEVEASDGSVQRTRVGVVGRLGCRHITLSNVTLAGREGGAPVSARGVSLTVRQSALRLAGSGMPSELIGIVMTAGEGGALGHLRITDSQVTGPSALAVAARVQSFELRRNRFQNGEIGGVLVDEVHEESWFTHNQVANVRGFGFLVGGDEEGVHSAGRIWIEDNLVERVEASLAVTETLYNGVDLGPTAAGIALWGAGLEGIVRRNHVAMDTSFSVLAASFDAAATFEENVLTSRGATAAGILQRCTQPDASRLSNNRILLVHGLVGIELHACPGAIVEGNEVDGSARSACFEACPGVSVVENRFRRSRPTPPLYGASLALLASPEAVLEGNVVCGHHHEAVAILDSSARLMNTQISDNLGRGLLIAESDVSLEGDNRLVGNEGAGIDCLTGRLVARNAHVTATRPAFHTPDGADGVVLRAGCIGEISGGRITHHPRAGLVLAGAGGSVEGVQLAENGSDCIRDGGEVALHGIECIEGTPPLADFDVAALECGVSDVAGVQLDNLRRWRPRPALPPGDLGLVSR